MNLPQIATKTDLIILPETLVNCYYPNLLKKSEFYKGAFYFIQFGLDGKIRLSASISKIKIIKKMERKSLFNSQKIQKKSEECVWQVNTDHSYDDYESKKLFKKRKICSVWQSTFEKPKEISDSHYREKIMRNAFKKQIQLKEDLLKEIFDSLDDRLHKIIQ
jgi:hypothetical protein